MKLQQLKCSKTQGSEHTSPGSTVPITVSTNAEKVAAAYGVSLRTIHVLPASLWSSKRRTAIVLLPAAS